MNIKILLTVVALFIYSSENVFAGGSQAPYIKATTVNRPFGVSKDANTMTVSFCNNDRNSINEAVKIKLQTKAIATKGKKPKKSAAKTKTYTVNTKTDANACGGATINVKNGLYNVKVRIKEKEGGSNGWWTTWSSYWTTN